MTSSNNFEGSIVGDNRFGGDLIALLNLSTTFLRGDCVQLAPSGFTLKEELFYAMKSLRLLYLVKFATGDKGIYLCFCCGA